MAFAVQEDVDYYKKWLDQDVVYIITPEEKAVFEKLTTAEEKQAFIEQFWVRRDPTPGSIDNEFKEEHYRRIQYANDHFTSGIDGWKTDRGRIYIVYGPPHERQTFPTGGAYHRTLSEGGGRTSTYPFERWFYRHLPGIGEGMEIEFIDPTHSGEYRMARHPGEKDALLFTPAGQTLHESLGLDTRYDRIARTFSLRDHSGEVLTRDLLTGKEKTFERLQQFFSLRRPPEIKFKDLQTQVESRVTYHQFPLLIRCDFFRIDRDKVIVPVTLRIENRDLTYQPVAGRQLRTRVQVYGRVESLQRRLHYEFEEELSSDIPESAAGQGALIYQKNIPLAPGRYKLTLVAKDIQGDRLSSREQAIAIPLGEGLEISPVMLTDNILPLEEGEGLPDAFVVPAGLKIYPTTDGIFDAERSMGLYYEIYGFGRDSATGAPAITVTHRLLLDDHPVYQEQMDLTRARATISETRVTITRILSLKPFGPGRFSLEIEIEDHISGKKTHRQTQYEAQAGKTKF